MARYPKTLPIEGSPSRYKTPTDGPVVRVIQAFKDMDGIVKGSRFYEQEPGIFYSYQSYPGHSAPFSLETFLAQGLLEANFDVQYISLYLVPGYNNRLKGHYDKIKCAEERIKRLKKEVETTEKKYAMLIENLRKITNPI